MIKIKIKCQTLYLAHAVSRRATVVISTVLYPVARIFKMVNYYSIYPTLRARANDMCGCVL